ncbi:beta-glucanase [Streptacidiphilus sp. ASG 303]|uniref:beta-glucanase n=1 Tax=Streptacidiphilus sp. ASG 303 TaxID=2896847 RepID=UPI001E433629|nr:beta-glucanase [Streptacidiphilus sp. ASG 303]MCD0485069.1 beta-glucanase [Streptacidiphilus sp. ASG 303]
MRKRHRPVRTAGMLLCPLLALAVCAQGTASARPQAPGLPMAGRHAAFGDEFDGLSLGEGARWGWQSGAYADCDSNKKNHKLDLLSPDAVSVDGGVLDITARKRDDGLWETGLLTTGDSCGSGGNGFTERTGDLVVAHVRLPGPEGGWPAVWSWRDGKNELDLFEWHAAHPDRLEFINHVANTGHYWKDRLVRPNAWLWLGVHLGARSVTWYAGASRAGMRAVWSDRRGVGRGFRAHPVINLSVDDGRYLPRPDPDAVLRFRVGFFGVYR